MIKPITKTGQTRKGRKPPSLSTLSKLWRKAVLKKCGNRCALCGETKDPAMLEAHHVIHRSQSGLLKWDIRNGLAVCKGKCHNEAHRAWGADMIAKRLGQVFIDLIELDRQTLKGHLAETGKTRAEWLREQYEKLKNNENI